MTKIKFCGLSRPCDIEAANRIRPDYIGFVFAEKSRRYITPEKAGELKRLLAPGILTVGVLADADLREAAELLKSGLIDMAQLHGSESESYAEQLRRLSGRPVIRAFPVRTEEDVRRAESSSADYILLDSGSGTGRTFDWEILEGLRRPYFLAGGLSPDNAEEAVRRLHPYAVDVSSGIETGGKKDGRKMAAFAAAVRKGGK